jgi:hypothetical protein
VLPAGGSVFEDTFANYPRWTAKSGELSAGSRNLPVASYFPYCTGGFTGARTPLVPAPRSPQLAPVGIILRLTASTLSSFRRNRQRPEAS